MTPSYRALTLLFVPVLLALTGLAGCGTDEAPAARPAAAPSSAQATAVVVAGPFNPDDFVDDLLTAIDAESSVHLTIDSAMGSAEADVDYSSGDATVRVTAAVDMRGDVNLVIADHVVYVEQGDGMYSVIDGSDPSYGPLLRRFQGLGPHDAVEGLRAGISEVVEEGVRRVDGTELRRYRLRVDPSKADGAFKALAGTSGMSSDAEFNLYVDEDDLLRRVEVELNGESTTVSLDDWSAPVAITVPRSVDLITPASPGPF